MSQSYRLADSARLLTGDVYDENQVIYACNRFSSFAYFAQNAALDRNNARIVFRTSECCWL